MRREGVLKIVLALVGLLFSAGVYSITGSLWPADQSMYTDDMMLSLYVALDIFLLMAVRNPSANRSLIAFTAWSSFAHAAVMAVMAVQKADERRGFLGAVLVIIGVALIRAGSGQAVRRAGIGSRCVTVATSPSLTMSAVSSSF